jgi:hypothetical protein
MPIKFERLDDLESRFQADLDSICETFNVERRSRKFEKWRTSSPYTFFLLNSDMELYRNSHLFV